VVAGAAAGVEAGGLQQRADLRAGDRSSSYGRPSKVAVPDVGRTSPSSMRRVVVLPEPFGPRNPVTAPGRTCAVSRSTARVAPKRLVSPSNRSVVPIDLPPPMIFLGT
jgi:hypothetical protein